MSQGKPAAANDRRLSAAPPSPRRFSDAAQNRVSAVAAPVPTDGGALDAPHAVLATSPNLTSAAAAAAVVAAPPLTARAAVAAPAGDVVSGILTGLAKLFGVSPGPATFSELILGALDAFRRQLKSIQFKSVPTATPVQFGQTPDNKIVGTVGAIDAEGDHLSYTVSQAAQFGSVVVDSDGSYTYTPQSAFLRSGGTDTFTVGVIESRLPVVSSSLESAFGRTTDVVVTVAVNATSPRVFAGYTQRFTVVNWTSGEMRYIGAYGSGLDSGPTLGTTYGTGDYASFEVKRELNTTNTTQQTFTVSGLGGQPVLTTVEMQTTGWTGDGTSQCYSSSLNCKTANGGETVFLLEAPGTTFEVPASDKAAQARILALCDKAAQCTNTVTREEIGTLTQVREISAGIRNYARTYSRDVKEILNFTSSVTQSKEFSVAVSASVGLSWVASVELQVQAAKSWTSSRAYTDGVFSDIYGVPTILADGTPLPEGTYRVGSVWAEEPINRVYSDVIVHLGNTTWNVRDLTLDYPDPTRKPAWFVKKELVLPDGTRLPGLDVPSA